MPAAWLLGAASLCACASTAAGHAPPSQLAGGAPPASSSQAAPEAVDPTFGITIGGTVTTPAGNVPLVHATSLHEGDRLAVTVETTKKTTVYVGYCDTEQHLAIYPRHGEPPLIASLGQPVRAPRDDYFTADNHHGPEQLVVLAVAGDLAETDPELAKTIEAARQGAHGASCESSAIVETTNESRKRASLPPIAEHVPRVVRSAGAGRPARLRPGSAWLARGLGLGETPQTVSFHSDGAGIATWVFTLQHE